MLDTVIASLPTAPLRRCSEARTASRRSEAIECMLVPVATLTMVPFAPSVRNINLRDKTPNNKFRRLDLKIQSFLKIPEIAGGFYHPTSIPAEHFSIDQYYLGLRKKRLQLFNMFVFERKGF